MSSPQDPPKTKAARGKGVPYTPKYAGYRGAVGAVAIDTRKNRQREVCHSDKSNDNGENDGDRLVNDEKEYHEANEK